MNQLLPDGPKRFYADRPFDIARSAEPFERLAGLGRYDLYVRALNVPMDPALEARLEGRPVHDFAGFRLYDLTRTSGSMGTNGTIGTPDNMGAGSAGSPGSMLVSLVPPVKTAVLDVRFGEKLRAIGFALYAPVRRSGPAHPPSSFFGIQGDPLAGGGIVKVVTSWEALEPDLPDWVLQVALSPKAETPPTIVLPLITLPDDRNPVFSRWRGHSIFSLESDFFFLQGAAGGDYNLRFGVVDGGRNVRPVPAGPQRPLLKVVSIEGIPLSIEQMTRLKYCRDSTGLSAVESHTIPDHTYMGVENGEMQVDALSPLVLWNSRLLRRRHDHGDRVSRRDDGQAGQDCAGQDCAGQNDR